MQTNKDQGKNKEGKLKWMTVCLKKPFSTETTYNTSDLKIMIDGFLVSVL